MIPRPSLTDTSFQDWIITLTPFLEYRTTKDSEDNSVSEGLYGYTASSDHVELFIFARDLLDAQTQLKKIIAPNRYASRVLADLAEASTPYRAASPERPERPAKSKETYRYGKGPELPEGIFKGSPSSIANTLKSKSRTYDEAMSRLTGYMNRRGSTLQRADEIRLEKAKDALRQAYGKDPIQ